MYLKKIDISNQNKSNNYYSKTKQPNFKACMKITGYPDVINIVKTKLRKLYPDLETIESDYYYDILRGGGVHYMCTGLDAELLRKAKRYPQKSNLDSSNSVGETFLRLSDMAKRLRYCHSASEVIKALNGIDGYQLRSSDFKITTPWSRFWS